MIEAVFISDLHLHPQMPDISARFEDFIAWAKGSVKKVYILGDFFHVWAGDDEANAWSLGIASQLQELKKAGIALYYMAGNRDFLLGQDFAKKAGWEVLVEPTIIQLGGEPILLVHGDGYCTKDKSHQSFRKLTRNPIFTKLFLTLPLTWRKKLVERVRSQSAMNKTKTIEQMDVVEEAVIADMKSKQCKLLIHGHTHQCGLSTYFIDGIEYKRYVLSDWDDIPELLCYHSTKGLYFTRI